MTPLDLIVWAAAFAGAVILVSIALLVVVLAVKAARAPLKTGATRPRRE